MAEIVGVVRFISTLDGRDMDRQAEKAGQQAGKAASKGYDKEWQSAFRKTLTKSGQQSFDRWVKSGQKDGGAYGKVFSQSLEKFVNRGMQRAADSITRIRLQPGFIDDFAKGFGDAESAVADLNEQIRLMEGHMDGRVLRGARAQVDEWAASQREAAEASERHRLAVADLNEQIRRDANVAAINAAERQRQAEATERLRVALQRSVNEIEQTSESTRRATRDIDDMSKSTKGLNLHWKDLSHNTRQWTLIIGAIASGMQDLAVLGSAAGAGLIALGGAATSGLAGLGGVVGVFVTLSKEADELPRSLRGVKAEFDRLKPAFTDLRNVVAGGAFSEMQGTFTEMERSLRSLSPELALLGKSVGRVFDDFADGTKVGSEGLDEIRKSLRLAGPNFEALADTAGTFGLALLRSFNRAQPLVQGLIGYVDTLARRFDAFTRSGGFTDWMRNAEITFSHLGPLIDAAARALNDLVTPETVAQTAQFLDDLAGFMPILSDILGILGSLNPFGLIAQALNETNTALTPLLPALDELATALSSAIAAALPGIAAGLGAVATILAPLATAAADFVNALPPELLQAIATGITLIASAVVTLKAAGAAAALLGFTDTAVAARDAASRLGGTLKSSLGKAGLAGAAIVGSLALTEAVSQLARDLTDLDAQAKNFVVSGAKIDDIFRRLNSDSSGNSLVGKWEDMGAALDELKNVGTGVGGIFQNMGLAFSETGSQALALSGTLKEIDKPLAEMANSSLPAATDRFSMWAEQLGATDEQVLTMLDNMPEFKAILESIAEQGDGVATSQELVALALGQTTIAADGTVTALTNLDGTSALTTEQIADMADAIAKTNEQFFVSRDAARDYQAALDDLSGSISENGTILDINTAEGRANEQAIDDLAQAALNLSGEILKETGSQEKANAAVSQGRTDLIKLLEQFGITGGAAEDYANQLGLIPKNIVTDVSINTGNAQTSIDKFVQTNNGRRITIYMDGTFTTQPGGIRGYASGGTLYGPQRILAGEAGPEAIVPLNRPLSQVDESVRWLSAIAQGKSTPAMASGGTVGVGGGINIAEGAIVVEDRSGDPRRTGNEVLQRIVENAVG